MNREIIKFSNEWLMFQKSGRSEVKINFRSVRIDFVWNTDINQLIIFRFMTFRKYNPDFYLNWEIFQKFFNS